MQIIHISAECYPVAKVGGLGDVVGALPKYINQMEKHQAVVVMPFLENKFTQTHKLEVDHKATLPFGYDTLNVTILKNNDLNLPIYLVKIEEFFYRTEVYGYDSDHYFFTAFQIATLNWLNQWKDLPDIIHCHDYHTGFIPFMIKHAHQFSRLRDLSTVYTIHNGEYQGKMSWDIIDFFPWFDTWQLPLLEWDDSVNAMASAIKSAWQVTTVSPEYMKELMSCSHPLSELLKSESQKCIGILNGIDFKEWNPSNDKHLEHQYNNKYYKRGKKINKKYLSEKFDFNPKYPLISFIGRFVSQKGVDILSDAIWRAIKEYDTKINFLILGSGDEQITLGLEQMKIFTDSRFNTYFGYNESLARKVYAGSDFLIMPSRFEPCGLNQFYAMRYGTVPIVRAVGGLKDSITDIKSKKGNGIRFENLSSDDILHSFYRANKLYLDKDIMNSTIEFIMQQDFSWEKSAKKYITLYETIRQ